MRGLTRLATPLLATCLLLLVMGAAVSLLPAAGGLSLVRWPWSSEQPIEDVSANRAATFAATALNPPAMLQTYPSLANGEALATLSPAVHGRLPKAGMPERLAWSQEPQYAVAREAVFDDWRAHEAAAPLPPLAPGTPLTCGGARHSPVPRHHCHVFVNHKYRVVYIRSPKSGSTSIMNWLGQCRYNKTINYNATTCMEYSWCVRPPGCLFCCLSTPKQSMYLWLLP